MNYSVQLQSALMHAYDTAKKLKHNCVATEHLLIGMMKIEDSRLNQALIREGITSELLMQDLQILFGFGADQPCGTMMTDTVCDVLKKAESDSCRNHLHEVSLDDVIYALFESENNVAQELLRRRGVEINELIQNLNQYSFCDFVA